MQLDAVPRASRWLHRSRFLSALLWILVVILAAVAVNVTGIRIVGSVSGWAHWLHAHRAFFLIWRLCLYGVTACGWWWMRERVRQQEPGAHRRLRRAELATVLAIMALEGVALINR